MALSPLAGKPAPAGILIDVRRLLEEYDHRRPDPADPRQRVSFGTSGHRGSPLEGSFNEALVGAPVLFSSDDSCWPHRKARSAP